MKEGAGIRNEEWHEETATLIKQLRQAFGADQQEAVFEILERTTEDPMACAEHLEALIRFCESDDEGARWAAAAAIGNIVEREPQVATSYIDRLVAILNDESEAVRESVSSALTHLESNLESTLEIPVSSLLSILERGDESTVEAVDVLSNIVTKRPSAVPTSRLERMADMDDETTRTGAQYLLTLHATVDQCESPYKPTREEYYEFSKVIPQGLPSGQSNQFAFNVIQQCAIDLFLSTELISAGYHGMYISKTPIGRQLTLQIKDPSAVVDIYGDPNKLASELSERFEIQKPKIDLQRVSG